MVRKVSTKKVGLLASIAKAWPRPQVRDTSKGDWVDQKGEDLGVTELAKTDQVQAEKAVRWAKQSRP